MQTGEGKQLLMLTTCCTIQGRETQVNCRQSLWTEGAGRAVCSTRGVLKDDQDDEMRDRIILHPYMYSHTHQAKQIKQNKRIRNSTLYAMPVAFLKYAYFCRAFTDAGM